MQIRELTLALVVEERFLMGVKRPVYSPAEKGASER
jgi:hypothetical protein